MIARRKASRAAQDVFDQLAKAGLGIEIPRYMGETGRSHGGAFCPVASQGIDGRGKGGVVVRDHQGRAVQLCEPRRALPGGDQGQSVGQGFHGLDLEARAIAHGVDDDIQLLVALLQRCL